MRVRGRIGRPCIQGVDRDGSRAVIRVRILRKLIQNRCDHMSVPGVIRTIFLNIILIDSDKNDIAGNRGTLLEKRVLHHDVKTPKEPFAAQKCNDKGSDQREYKFFIVFTHPLIHPQNS